MTCRVAAISVLAVVAGCQAPGQSFQACYTGGLVVGTVIDDEWSVTLVSWYPECPNGLAARTWIVASDGAVLPLLDITPEYLLQQDGATFTCMRQEEAPCNTLAEFEPCKSYYCRLNGGSSDLHIDIRGGEATGYSVTGYAMSPSRVKFVAPSGNQFELPLTKAQVIELWGEPQEALMLYRCGG